jgi:hypothetical protein
MPSTRSPSVTPSDSVSHIGSRLGSDGFGSQTSRSDSRSKNMSRSHHLQHQPATRPADYPEEVLWSLEDCKADPNVNVSATNTSRPSMEKAIRHSDGTMITSSEWNAIKVSARAVKADLLSLPPPRDRRAKDQKRTKVYFRTYFRHEWDSALAKLEMYQPLVALCSSHWKADHILGNTLLVKATERSEDDQSDPNEHTGSSRRSESKKRTGKQHSRDRKRRKKGNGKAVSSDKEADGGKSDDMSIRKPFNYIPYNPGSYSYSAAPSNASEQSKVQLPPSSFMQGNMSTQPDAVDISFIQVDTSSMSYSLCFTVYVTQILLVPVDNLSSKANTHV